MYRTRSSCFVRGKLFAISRKYHRTSEDPQNTAVALYFQERQYLLRIIATLIKARYDDGIDDDLRSYIVLFSNRRIKNGLTTRIMELLKGELTAKRPENSLENTLRSFQVIEADMMIEILFLLYYQTLIPESEAKELINLLQSFSNRTVELAEDTNNPFRLDTLRVTS